MCLLSVGGITALPGGDLIYNMCNYIITAPTPDTMIILCLNYQRLFKELIKTHNSVKS
jgi:hypothetical protein